MRFEKPKAETNAKQAITHDTSAPVKAMQTLKMG